MNPTVSALPAKSWLPLSCSEHLLEMPVSALLDQKHLWHTSGHFLFSSNIGPEGCFDGFGVAPQLV